MNDNKHSQAVQSTVLVQATAALESTVAKELKEEDKPEVAQAILNQLVGKANNDKITE